MLQQFEASLTRINTYLKFIGMSIDRDDCNITMVQRLKKHWILSIHLFSFNFALAGQLLWFGHVLLFGTTLWEVTYSIPCITLCVLGSMKLFCFVRYIKLVNDLIDVFRVLLVNEPQFGEEGEPKMWLKFLSSIINFIISLFIFGYIAFAVGPFLIMGSNYLSTGHSELVLPFLLYYPFDAYDIRYWPFVYVHQMVSAFYVVCAINGTDTFFYTCCTFIQIQFMILHRNLEEIVKKDSWNRSDYTIDAFKAELIQIVTHHQELMRCVDAVQIIYSTSTLFNLTSSTLIIVAAGFNLMAIENLTLVAPFTVFLVFGFLQIFMYCYYGDSLLTTSVALGDAVYNSRWYETGAAERRYLLMVLLRSQKPCKLTACGYTDIQLKAFTKILSTSWSCFALLKQMYHN